MKTNEIRQLFLDYFEQQGHQKIASSSLVPANDPTLLFVNAGMVPFKNYFLGTETPKSLRATSSQRCVRAGGKHNDLENVGYTARHHTFFEMLGNFSFGDYFKQDAIRFAWEFLTQVLKLPKEKLWVTVYKDDKEAEDIWFNEIGINQDRFSRLGEKDNFWSMGDTGPCGPCSEIFYDHGEGVSGGPPGSPEEDGDRYIEIWNLVFMQFNRDKNGHLSSLPKPSVDTGMGLERITAVMQNVHSNYEIDIFKELIAAAAKEIGCNDLNQQSLKVVADHIRSCAFLIADGVVPSNEGRGYVLRRIIRRAVRHGALLGGETGFFSNLVPALLGQMASAYPILLQQESQIKNLLRKEEEQFAKTLQQGLKILEQDISTLNTSVIPGETVFKLYDTYGFPVDLTADIGREKNLTLDEAGFDRLMSEQKQRARAASQFDSDYDETINLEDSSEFTGYAQSEGKSQVIRLLKANEPSQQLEKGDNGIVVLNLTPFYAESGGQVGDTGELESDTGLFVVKDTIKLNDAILHKGYVKSGKIILGDKLVAKIDRERRQAIVLNHSATHLLHAALRKVLGEHITQKGSLVEAERLRFDFSHLQPVTEAELISIENLVNARIRVNDTVDTEILPMEAAIEKGAMALFGEKYGEQVRVLSMSDFSIELCGGTHVKRTGDIGCFKIISETGIAAGVRRIEAVSGEIALSWIQASEQKLKAISQLLKTDPSHLLERVESTLEKNKSLEKTVERLKSKLASNKGDDLLAQAKEINGAKVLAVSLEGAEPKTLRDTLDQLKNKLGSCVLVLATHDNKKVNLAAGVSKDLITKVKAGELVNMVAQQVGGKGGGRPDMAQAGGSQPENLGSALASVEPWLTEKL